jgi:CubicO group peptidase (beta-lactamase class C family)
MVDRRRFISTAVSVPVAAALSAVWPSLQTAAAYEAPFDLGPTLEQIRRRCGVPAIGAVAVSTDRIIARGVAGFRRMGEPGAVSTDACWQLGSVTKNFGGTLAAVLVESGKLSWDATLRQLYPEHLAVMAPNVPDITIRQLMTHHSGFVHVDPYPWPGGPEINGPGLTLSQRRQRAMPAAFRQPLLFTPGARFSYSNRGYIVLAAVCEKVTGRSYEDLITDEIARPLGFGPIYFGEPALDNPNREPWPHVAEGARWKPAAPLPREQYGYHVANPAGGLSLTLDQCALWMQAHLLGEQLGGIGSPEMFKTLHTPLGRGGVSPFGVTFRDPMFGRHLWMAGTNGRNFAEYMILLDRGVGIFSAVNAVPPAGNLESFFTMKTLLASALPGRPAPALTPPQPDAAGNIEGEALDIARIGGGSIEFQNLMQLSGQWQLWWVNAKDGQQLVLRLAVPTRGRYAVEGIFARNRDYGDVTFALRSLRTRLSFRTETLAWETMALGEVPLDAGVHELTVTAHGNAGEGGIGCHLGLDVLRLRKISE